MVKLKQIKKILLILIITLSLTIPLPINALKNISAPTVAIDNNRGRILYENRAHEKRLIASTTKILTAIVVLENNDLNKKVTVGNEVLKMYGTSIYLQVGEKMKVEDLLYGLLLRSGNDAAVVLATATSGSEENFVKLMNKKAKEIGMNDSTFANSHGLDEETKNYSTAYDMALLSKYASKNKTYQKIVATKKYELSTGTKTYLWYNRNKLLSNYEFCTGGKNGYTPSAGKTLVTTAKKDNLNISIVTLNDGDEYTTHQELYEYLFENYKNYKIIDKNIFNSTKSYTDENLYIKKSFSYPLTPKETDQIKTLISINNQNKNKVGEISIYLKDDKIGSLDIYKNKQKKKETFLQKIKNLFIR